MKTSYFQYAHWNRQENTRALVQGCKEAYTLRETRIAFIHTVPRDLDSRHNARHANLEPVPAVPETRRRSDTLLGHTDTITSLQLSPDNMTLLSNAHDSTVRTWDVRPFAPADRRLLTFDGAPTGQERNLLKASWDPKGEKIAAGSGDQSVAIWEARSGKLLNKLPGHRGAVNDVRFSPRDEPIRKWSLVPFCSPSLPGTFALVLCFQYGRVASIKMAGRTGTVSCHLPTRKRQDH